MKKSGSFTLIELLIVMSVIAIIISIALPSFKGMQQQAKIINAQGDLRTLKVAIEDYYTNNAAYPAASGYQTTLINAVPQILTSVQTDPLSSTNTIYAYALSSNSAYYVIYSVGVSGNGSASVATTGVVSATGGAIWDGNGH